MRFLVVGGGAREHALVNRLCKAPGLEAVLAAPGNAGIAAVANILPVPLSDIDAIVAAACSARIDFAVIGPEAPLAAGIADRLEAAGIPTFGPSAAAAQIEVSKAFMKGICVAAGVPTADFAVFDDAQAACRWVRQRNRPMVVKADGLAAGKGVVVAETLEETLAAVTDILGPANGTGGRFGAAGQRILIEERLAGEEVSLFAIANGRQAVLFGTARDHKRAFDGDQGANTGGMGAISPHPSLDAAMTDRIMRTIIHPVLNTLADQGHPFLGVLFAGLILVPDGQGGVNPHVLEFNARFGDPECQCLLARFNGDLAGLLLAARQGRLTDPEVTANIRFLPEVAVTVVMAANGYPDAPETGSEIRNLAKAAAMSGVEILHAATRMSGGRLLAAGGRVLSITATGPSAKAARERAYAAINLIDWPQGWCRGDIGMP